MSRFSAHSLGRTLNWILLGAPYGVTVCIMISVGLNKAQVAVWDNKEIILTIYDAPLTKNALQNLWYKFESDLWHPQWVNSLWPSDVIWRQGSLEVDIGSGNGLLPDGTKPLPEPMLTDHQWSPVTFILGQFHKRCLNHQSLKSVWNFNELIHEAMC